jgi:DNA-binding transcriptional LysR family regulator
MRESRLAGLEAFLLVAREKSFSRAARKLGVTASAVSQAVRKLEEKLGAPLFSRTTRAVRLTETGERLASRAGPAVETALTALEELPVHDRGVSGVLRINAPRIAVSRVMRALPHFLSANPGASVELTVEDKLVDIVAQGFDVGIRLHESLADGMVAIRLSPPFRFVVVGAPTYLSSRGRPKSIADLAAHDCIGMRLQSTGALYRWELLEAGKEVRVTVPGRVLLSGMSVALDAAKRGLGLAYLDEPTALAALRARELVIVLERAAVTVPGLFLYCPKAVQREPKIRAFIQACRAERDGP